MIGRDHELRILDKEYQSRKNGLTVIYGRRRIGKSYLIRSFCKGKPSLIIEGLEDKSSQVQMDSFVHEIKSQVKDFPIPNVKYTNWRQVLDLITLLLQTRKEKLVLCLDEFQWMALQRTPLVSLIKLYFDQKWADYKLMLVLCGSISSFMVKKVLNSKALYGRVTTELRLAPFTPKETYQFFKGKFTEEEVILLLMILGGIPKYLSECRTNESIEKNLDRLCFQPSGFLFNEFEKVFYSQFKEPMTYKKIVQFLTSGSKSLVDIASHLKMKSSGGFKDYLTNLELAGFISAESFPGRKNSKIIKYRISDPFISFYFKYMQSNRTALIKKPISRFFQNHVQPNYNAWLGLAFENFCNNNIKALTWSMDYSELPLTYGPMIIKGKPSVQLDLVLLVQGKIIVACEMKYRKEKISTDVIAEIKIKQNNLRTKYPKKIRIEWALIAPNGVTTSLKESQFFDHIVTTDDFFKN